MELHKTLSLDAEISQLQEEAAELIVACSKLRRKMISTEIATPKDADAVVDSMMEEIADTLAMMMTSVRAMAREGILTEEEAEEKITG